MKEIHIITSPISQTSTVLLVEEQEPSISELQSSSDGHIPAGYNNVVKIMLNLDENRERGGNRVGNYFRKPQFRF
jgi:hypothetical protein